jgi:hypothetical protein
VLRNASTRYLFPSISFRGKFALMTRLARMVVSGPPHHVTQRGNRRESIFFEDGDQEYRDRLGEQASRRAGGRGGVGLLPDAKPCPPELESSACGRARSCRGRSASPLHQFHQCTGPLDGVSSGKTLSLPVMYGRCLHSERAPIRKL